MNIATIFNLKMIRKKPACVGVRNDAPATGSAGFQPADGAERRPNRPNQPARCRRSQPLARHLPPPSLLSCVHTAPLPALTLLALALAALLPARAQLITSNTTRYIGSAGDQVKGGASADYVITDGVTLTITSTAQLNASGQIFTDNTAANTAHFTITQQGPLNTGGIVLDGAGSLSHLTSAGTNINGAAFWLGAGNNTVTLVGGTTSTGLVTGTIQNFWSGNSSNNGGAVLFSQTGNNSFSLTNFVVANNTAKATSIGNFYGGAIMAGNTGTTTLNFTNVQFINNVASGTQVNAFSAGYGGAIYFQGAGLMTLNNVAFYGNVASGSNTPSNYATGYGGAIYITNGTAVMNNVTFQGNVASGKATGASGTGTGYGGAIALATGANLTVTGGVFVSNSAFGFQPNGAGASFGSHFYMTGAAPKAVLNNIYVASGVVQNGGGAFYIDANGGTLAITGGTIANNRAGTLGGGIYMKPVTNNMIGTFDNVTFSGNSAGWNGGAVAWQIVSNAQQSGAFNNVLFTSNSVAGLAGTNRGDFYGGAVQFSSSARVSMTNVVFDNNVTDSSRSSGASSTSRGGALYVDNLAFLTVTNGTFRGNAALGSVSTIVNASGGAIYQDRATGTYNNVFFDRNKSISEGGALCEIINGNGTAAVTLTNATFTNNTASRGGALFAGVGSTSWVGAVTLTINNGTFANNKAATVDGYIIGNGGQGVGGAALILNNGGTTAPVTVTFSDVTFTGNTAKGTSGYGGAIALIGAGPGATLNLNITATGASAQNTTYINNAAYQQDVFPQANMGGFLYSGSNNTININIAPGKSLTIGGTDVTKDSIVADASAKITINAAAASPANTGQLILNADNSANQAPIQVAAGALLFGAAGPGAKLGGNITVAPGATFGGWGIASSATGAVSITSGNLQIGATHHDPAVTTPQTLAIPGTLLLTTSTLLYDIYPGSQSDLLSIGTLVQTGTTCVDMSIFRSGTFKLIDITTPGAPAIDLALLAPATFNGASVGAGYAEQYRLVDNSLYLILVVANNTLTWTGATSNIWTPVVNNWTGAISTQFNDGDKVTFNDTVANPAARLITIDPYGVRASDMIVSGTGDYAFNGGPITTSTDNTTLDAPAGKLLKTGAGALDLTAQTGTNDFQGGIDLVAGALRVSNAAQVGAPLSAVRFLGTPAASSTLALAPNATATFDAAGSAAQRITIAPGAAAALDLGASSTLTIANNNTAALAAPNGGAIAIAPGGALTLTAAPGAAYIFQNNKTSTAPAASGGAIHNAGQLTLTNAQFLNNTATLDGGAIANDNATLNLNVAANSLGSFAGNKAGGAPNSITTTATASNATLAINIAATGILDMADPMRGAAANGKTNTITNIGPGLWKLGGANTFTADANPASKTTLASTSGTLYLNPSASLTLAGAASTFTLGGPAATTPAVLALGGANTIAAPAGNIALAARSRLTFAAPAIGDTLTLTGTTTFNAATLDIRTALGNIADNIAVTGPVAFVATNTLNVTAWNTGTYAILTDNNALAAGAPATFAPVLYDGAALTARQTAALSLDATGKKLLLTLAATNASLTWAGALTTTWNTGDANWTGLDTRFIAHDAVLFDDTAPAAAHTVTVAPNGVQAAAMTVSTTGAYTFTGPGPIATGTAGTTLAATTGALTKLGSGTLTLANTAANNFSNGINLAAGALTGNADTLAAGTKGITDNGALTFDQATNATYASPITGAGSLTKTGAGNLTLAGAISHTGNTNLNAGALTLAAANQLASSATLTLAASTTLATGAAAQQLNHLNGAGNIATPAAGAAAGALTLANTAADTLYSGTISGAAAVTKTGPFTLTLAGDNTATGATTITTGTLQLGNGAASGNVAGPIVNNAALAINHGAADATITGAISGNGLINKLPADTGALTLTANSSAFTGTTNIAAGTLIVGGASSSPPAALGGLVTLAPGANLAGNGTLTGALTTLGSNTITVGLTHNDPTVTAPQTLAIGGTLALADATTLRYDLYAAGAADLITAGTLARAGTTTIDVNTASSGTYNLIRTTTALAATATANLLTTLNGDTLASRITATYGGNAANNLFLVITTTNLGAMRWSGTNTGQWIENSQNWQTTDQKFFAGDAVIFDDTAAGTRNVIVNTAGVRAADMTVSTTDSYTFTGGAITTGTTNSTIAATSTGALLKLGSGALILANDGTNNFTGGIIVSAGTLQGTTLTLNTGTAGILNNATLVFDQNATATYAAPITGTGALVKQNTGTLTLTNTASTYTGGISVADGTLELRNSGAATQGAIDIAPGAALRLTNATACTIAHPLTGSGLLVIDTAGNNVGASLAPPSAFTGTISLLATKLTLDATTASLAANATLKLNAGNTTTVATGTQQIGNLILDGAKLVFNVAPAGSPAAAGVIQTANLALNTGTVQVTLPATGFANPPPAGAMNILSQDDGPALTRLITATGTISGDASSLVLLDQNGATVNAATAQRIAISENGTVVATGNYNHALTSDGGLAVTYGLTGIELAPGQTLHLAPDAGATGAATDLGVPVTGTGNLSIAAATAANATVTLGNPNNTFTGTTTVTNGTLQLNAPNALGASGSNALVLASTGAVTLNNNPQSIGTLATDPATKLNLANTTLTILNGGQAGGALAGTGTLLLAGGNLILSAPATSDMAARTAITNSATATLRNLNALGTNIVTIQDPGSALVFDIAGTGTFANILNGSGGQLVKTNTGTVFIAAQNVNFSGSTTVDNGHLAINSLNALGASPVNVTVNTAGNLDYLMTGAIAGNVTGSGTLNLTGTAGVTTLTGTNTIANIAIWNGVQALAANAQSLGAPGARIAINSGTLTLGAPGMNLGDIVMTGAARLTFSATTAASPAFKHATVNSLASTGNDATIIFNANPANATNDTLTVTNAITGAYKLGLAITAAMPPPAFDIAFNVISAPAASTATYLPVTGTMPIGIFNYALNITGGNNPTINLHNTGDLSTLGSYIINTAGAVPLTSIIELDTLAKRMGDLRLNNRAQPGVDAWARAYTQNRNFNNHVTGAPFDEYHYGLDAGLDYGATDDNGFSTYAGAFAGYGRTSRHVRGGAGLGDTESHHAGIYLTLATAAGWYLDAIAKYDNFTNTFTVQPDPAAGPVTAHFETDAWAGSLEIGKRITLGKTKNWYVQPGIQAACTTIGATTYSTNTNIRVLSTAANLIQARAGVQAGYKHRTADGQLFQPYARLHIANQWQARNTVTIGLQRWNAAIDGSRVEAGVGFNWLVSKSAQLYFDYEFAAAKTYTEPYGFNLGIHFSW